MQLTLNQIISTGLIGTGTLVWALAGRPLVTDQSQKVPLNPMGINGSPYGEVFAMAMQGPIDTYFHGTGSISTHHHPTLAESQSLASVGAIRSGLQNLLTSLAETVAERTNPKSASDAHRLYLRRQVEDKLRFAYQLDPSHYANYNSLHFFLTEPQLGTRPQLTASAAKLADETIQYCLKRDDDPRPALTAAAATSNILELMFNDQHNPVPKFNTAQMHQYLNLLDHCIGRFVSISKEWDRTKNWELLSPQRMAECDDRFQYICKFRETAASIILRFETKSHGDQAFN